MVVSGLLSMAMAGAYCDAVAVNHVCPPASCFHDPLPTFFPLAAKRLLNWCMCEAQHHPICVLRLSAFYSEQVPLCALTAVSLLCSCRPPMQLLYNMELGFYISSIFMILFWEVRRKDFAAMFSHHIATVILISTSMYFR